MDRARLLAEITEAGPGPDDVVFVERRGDDYRWNRLEPGSPAGFARQQPGGVAPDAWIYYSGPWPADPPADLPRFLEDLLAEMESMCGGADRCRWPLDQPYPLGH
ncbi:MAG TPA: hypothetical protein VGN41_23200 [Streptosporangiaceae bacterium]